MLKDNKRCRKLKNISKLTKEELQEFLPTFLEEKDIVIDNNEIYKGRLFYVGDRRESLWAHCKITGCSNRTYLREQSEFCYPHSKWYRPILAWIRKFTIKLV